MSYRLFLLLAAFSVSIIVFILATRRRPSRLLVLLTAFSLTAAGQSSSGILDASRAIDWSQAGVVGGVPSGSWTQCGSTIAAGASASTIQAAINSCPANHYVQLGAGTFNLSTGLTMVSNVVLRGQGANQTILNFNGAAGCFYGGAAICISSDLYTHNNDGVFSYPGQSQAANWTAGYNQGATSITLGTVGSNGVVNGQYIFLNQANDTTVLSNALFSCDKTTPACSIEGGAPGQTIGGTNYSQLQVVKVIGGCATKCTGAGPFTVTISPGLYGKNWSSGKNPYAWWPNPMIQHAGVENMSLNLSNSGLSDNGAAVNIYNGANNWVTGVAVLHGSRAGVWIFEGGHNTVQSNYFYQTIDAGSQSYGVELDLASDNLVVNNIMQQVTAPMMGGAQFGNVWAYNFGVNQYQTVSANCMYPAVDFAHDAAAQYNLYEGNFMSNYEGDVVHGSSGLNTLFRNVATGYELGKTCATNAVDLDPYERYENVVGNVFGTPGYALHYDDFASPNPPDENFAPQYIYILDQAHGGLGPDAFTGSSLLRWANYDSVTRAVRFCGNSTDTGWAACTQGSEVPTAVGTYPNSIPTFGDTGKGQNPMTASFIYSAAPSWWPSGKPWPPVGPDVTSGNLGQCTTGTYALLMATNSTQCAGGSFSAHVNAGHVNSTPAQDCYLNVMHGPPDGSGGALSFNASSCYSSSGAIDATGPGSPTGLTAIVQ
jgi:hypothetical protein